MLLAYGLPTPLVGAAGIFHVPNGWLRLHRRLNERVPDLGPGDGNLVGMNGKSEAIVLGSLTCNVI